MNRGLIVCAWLRTIRPCAHVPPDVFYTLCHETFDPAAVPSSHPRPAAATLWATGPPSFAPRPATSCESRSSAVGGRGGANLKGVSSEHIAALCDVDRNALDKVAATYPQARKEVDFRRVFDHANEFDAVVVSTCEHTHAFATLPALQLRKHVYCEKPLTHNV